MRLSRTGQLTHHAFGVTMMDMKSAERVDRRPYRMTARAEAAAATGERILDAAVELFVAKPLDEISLDELAQRAGVSGRTIIRRFGGKREILAAATAREGTRIRAQRDEAQPGDLPQAVKVLLDHYEELGERVLRMLAEEIRRPELVPILKEGREVHAQWCERVFGPALAGLRGPERDRRLAQFVALCDVYTWKLLRLDRGLSRRATERALVEMLQPLT